MKDFKKLNIWNDSLAIVNMVYLLSKELPESEKFGLASQITRAAVSIPSNIAEGFSRDTDKGFSNYLSIALGSSFEVETQLEIIKMNFNVNKEKIDTLTVKLNELQKRINALKNKLKG